MTPRISSITYCCDRPWGYHGEHLCGLPQGHDGLCECDCGSEIDPDDEDAE